MKIKKKGASALCTFLIVYYLIPLKPFGNHLKPFPLTCHKEEGDVPACHNILHCHPEQLFPFLSPVWLIQLLYWEGKSGGGGGGGQKQQQKSQRDAVILSFGSEMSQKHHTFCQSVSTLQM